MATTIEEARKPKRKSATAKQVATAYFDAIKPRDLDAMAAVWKPGGQRPLLRDGRPCGCPRT